MQYPAFYDYMTCMGVNPCWGWLNTNETWRNATQARADELNVEYGKLVGQRRGEFKNFKLLYFDPDLEPMIGKYMALGGDWERIDCIEPCDGFHPSQPLHELYAGAMNEGPVASSFQKETHRIR